MHPTFGRTDSKRGSVFSAVEAGNGVKFNLLETTNCFLLHFHFLPRYSYIRYRPQRQHVEVFCFITEKGLKHNRLAKHCANGDVATHVCIAVKLFFSKFSGDVEACFSKYV
jgi:hypothetical protein